MSVPLLTDFLKGRDNGPVPFKQYKNVWPETDQGSPEHPAECISSDHGGYRTN